MTHRIRHPTDGDRDAAAFDYPRGRRYRDNEIKFFTIRRSRFVWTSPPAPSAAGSLDGDLVAHRVGSVVRVSERICERFWLCIAKAKRRGT